MSSNIFSRNLKDKGKCKVTVVILLLPFGQYLKLMYFNNYAKKYAKRMDWLIAPKILLDNLIQYPRFDMGCHR